LCYTPLMKKILFKCLDVYEIFGNELRCRFDLNNYPIHHSHDYWEIMIILDGTYHQIVNEEEVVMPKHTALLLRPGDAHRITQSKPTDKHLTVMINCGYMKEMCNFFDESLHNKLLSTPPSPIFLTASQEQSITSVARELQLYPLNHLPQRLKRMLITFFLNFYQLQFDIKSAEYPPVFQKLFQMLSQPESVKMNVKDLAALTGYSYSHFAKLFKTLVGVSANEYLTEKKLNYAAHALLTLNASVSQLALELGYQSLGYFTNLFKKHYGMSPSQYKKLAQQ